MICVFFMCQTGVKRHHLLTRGGLKSLPSPTHTQVTYGVINDLNTVKAKEVAYHQLRREWLTFLCIDHSQLSDAQILARFKKVKKELGNLRKSIGKPGYAQKYEQLTRQPVTKYFR